RVAVGAAQRGAHEAVADDALLFAVARVAVVAVGGGLASLWAGVALRWAGVASGIAAEARVVSASGGACHEGDRAQQNQDPTAKHQSRCYRSGRRPRRGPWSLVPLSTRRAHSIWSRISPIGHAA